MALFLCQAVINHVLSMTNRQWVTLSVINHVLSYDQQAVSDTASFFAVSIMSHSHDQQLVSVTALFLCQEVSSIISHPMTNFRQSVTLLYFFARQSDQSCFIP
jgi:Na+/melibiose symporter-like transporter